MRDTIFALATAPGRAAVAVVRVSGPDSGRALLALTGALPPARYAALRLVRAPDSGERLDQALVLWFPGPNSFTGEDQAELHLHGGRAVVEAVLGALNSVGLRAAEAGEFTRRAFENGKLDLLEAEGVADLIDAETQAQRRQALDQLRGALRGRESRWRKLLVGALSLLEAAIDFPDEEVPGGVVDQALELIAELETELVVAIGDARGERVREGFRVAILGRPNAGKSSLLNALADREAAIVTPWAGTTRDVIEVWLNIAGYPVVLGDTAGLRATDDTIEAEGVRRGLQWAEAAALRVFVVDAAQGDPASFGEADRLMRPGDVVALNKMDLCGRAQAQPWKDYATRCGMACVETRAALRSVEALQAALRDKVVGDLAAGDVPYVTRERHRRSLTSAANHLHRAGLREGQVELIAENVRLAARSLAGLSGGIGAEDVLDEVFSSFCIGK